MNKKELLLAMEERKKIRAAIYVASDFEDENGKKVIASQVDCIKCFTDLHSNIDIIDTFVDSRTGIQLLLARRTMIELRKAIDSGKFDVVIIASLKSAICRVSNFQSIVNLASKTDICLLEAEFSDADTWKLYDNRDLKKMKSEQMKTMTELGLVDKLKKEVRTRK